MNGAAVGVSSGSRVDIPGIGYVTVDQRVVVSPPNADAYRALRGRPRPPPRRRLARPSGGHRGARRLRRRRHQPGHRGTRSRRQGRAAGASDGHDRHHSERRGRRLAAADRAAAVRHRGRAGHRRRRPAWQRRDAARRLLARPADRPPRRRRRCSARATSSRSPVARASRTTSARRAPTRASTRASTSSRRSARRCSPSTTARSCRSAGATSADARSGCATATGNLFYYGHLSAYAPVAKTGAQVHAGDVIGFLGDSGDAQGTPFHLHFEIHPAGKWAVPPYAYVSAWLDNSAPLGGVTPAREHPVALVPLASFDISTADGPRPAVGRRRRQRPVRPRGRHRRDRRRPAGSERRAAARPVAAGRSVPGRRVAAHSRGARRLPAWTSTPQPHCSPSATSRPTA